MSTIYAQSIADKIKLTMGEGRTKLQGRTRGSYTSSGTTNIGGRYATHTGTKSRGSSPRSST